MKKTKERIHLQTPKDSTYKSAKEFIFGRKLGEGAYATVMKAIHIGTRETVAIKIIDLKTLNENDHQNIENEVEIHSKLDYPRIVKFRGHFVEHVNFFYF